jgi:hypothetical protein
MNKIYLTVPKKILRRNNTYKLENTEGTTKRRKEKLAIYTDIYIT